MGAPHELYDPDGWKRMPRANGAVIYRDTALTTFCACTWYRILSKGIVYSFQEASFQEAWGMNPSQAVGLGNGVYVCVLDFHTL